MTSPEDTALLDPRAKWRDKPPASCHPLLFHMLDVAWTAQAIWRDCLHEGCRKWVCDGLGLPGKEEKAGGLLAFWAGLHDLGKAYRGFQEQSANARTHGVVTAIALEEILQKEFGYPQRLASQVATILGGHHGIFPSSSDLQGYDADIADQKGKAVRVGLARRLTKELREPPAPNCGELRPSLGLFLAGLVSVSDWVGSNDAPCCFPHEVQAARLEQYLAGHEDAIGDYTRQRGARPEGALKSLHWTGWRPAQEERGIEDLFDAIREHGARPLQQKVVELGGRLTAPFLVIVEAPMGEGKTEAALYLADRFNTSDQQRGFYVALPTMATSNQMFSRVRDYLKERYRESDEVNYILLHGHAALSAEFEVLRQNGDRLCTPRVQPDKAAKDEDGQVLAGGWFTHRKRGLLAPFGVGTVDQILLAVLQTKHVFVRLFGLSHKTIIIDEVHAYDAYMTTLLERVLEWLAALRSPVVLLSATLPQDKRDGLIRAYARGLGMNEQESHQLVVPRKDYPRLTWATAAKASPSASGASGVVCDSEHVEASEDVKKDISLVWIDGRLPAEGGGPFPLGERLKEALREGGCAAVICNTVGRAQEVYRALKPYFPDKDKADGLPELDLFHARYLFKDREEREHRALVRFGKPGDKVVCGKDDVRPVKRPWRAVLVATQVIEQSLDLDFDLMVTDLAPVDLVLQRAGRLHRHKRGTCARPLALGTREGTPQLWVCRPEKMDGDVPDFGMADEIIYDRYVLLRTWVALDEGCPIRISVPERMAGLIEGVYGKDGPPASPSPAIRSELDEARKEYDAGLRGEESEAKDRWIRKPRYTGHLSNLTRDAREEDNPEFHLAHQALTRLSGPSIQVACIREAEWLESEPDAQRTIQILWSSVRISHGGLVKCLLAFEAPGRWQKSPLLRHHRPIVLDHQGKSNVCGYLIRLDEEEGVRIERGEPR